MQCSNIAVTTRQLGVTLDRIGIGTDRISLFEIKLKRWLCCFRQLRASTRLETQLAEAYPIRWFMSMMKESATLARRKERDQ